LIEEEPSIIQAFNINHLIQREFYYLLFRSEINMAIHSKLLSRLLLLLSFIFLATASPVVKRTNMDLESSTPTVVWNSNGNTVNNMRNYHIRATDGMIMESGRDSVGGSWGTNPLGIYGRVMGGLTACVVKLSDAQFDVEIRIFFEDINSLGQDAEGQERYRMKSAYYKPSTGWVVDTNFTYNVGYVARPASVITWKDTAGIQQYRLYFVSRKRTTSINWIVAAVDIVGLAVDFYISPFQDSGENTVYEALLSGSGSWTMGSGGNAIATSTVGDFTISGSVSAVVWRAGARISVFYWDNVAINSQQRPGQIREMRWKAGIGWEQQAMPNSDFKNFASVGSLSAVTWVDGSNDDQIRLYVKWVNDCVACYTKQGLRMVEFIANSGGWSKQQDMPDFMVSGSLTTSPINTVAWTYPDANNVHLRMFYPRCQSGDSDCSGYKGYVHEVNFDTGVGWVDGVNIDR
jgi:hypothetical protein